MSMKDHFAVNEAIHLSADGVLIPPRECCRNHGKPLGAYATR